MINLMIQAGFRPGKSANAGWGGPPSRSRRERIKSSLLGNDDGQIRCPRIIRIGFFLSSGDNPMESLETLLAEEGYGSPEDLRSDITIPDRPYICRPALPPGPCPFSAPRVEVLRQALMLGLCTAQVFDPARPVIWTKGSLSRVVELFDPEGFYA
jgi:hypothetical protein